MFEIKVKGLDKLQGSIRKNPKVVFEELSRAVKTSVNLIRPIMRSETPVGETHKLSGNIQARSAGLKGEVGPNLQITPYAWYVHEGYGPFTIRPKQKKALWWPGAKHPVKKVEHPGYAGNPFVERTFDRIKEPVEKVFEKSIDAIISKFHRG